MAPRRPPVRARPAGRDVRRRSRASRAPRPRPLRSGCRPPSRGHHATARRTAPPAARAARAHAPRRSRHRSPRSRVRRRRARTRRPRPPATVTCPPHLPGDLGDGGPRPVRRHRADLVDVARIHLTEVERLGVGCDPAHQVVGARRAIGSQPRQGGGIAGVHSRDECRQRFRRVRRAGAGRVDRTLFDLVPATPLHDHDEHDGEHRDHEQRKTGRPQQWTTGLRGLLVSQDGPRRRKAWSRDRRRRPPCPGWRRGRSSRCRCTCRRG